MIAAPVGEFPPGNAPRLIPFPAPDKKATIRADGGGGMAEKAVVAFGRYLKLLRERRKLSLDDVVALTKAYPEPINKGYLSRAERGLSHIAFSKIVALGRAYEVPVDVFGEKLSLDLEVERLKDAPETEARSFRELIEEGGRLAERGLRLHAYGVWRSVVHRAHAEPVAPNYRSLEEQIAAATVSHGVLAGSLGRYALSRHEVEHALALGALSAEYLPVASIHLAVVYRRLRDFERARHFAEQAISEARRSTAGKYLGDALAARALLADVEGDSIKSIELYKEAFAQFRKQRRPADCARTMSNLANVFVAVQRFGAARKSLDAAYRLATRSHADGIRARARILLGEIEARQGNMQRARALWLEALDVAKQSDDRVAAFKAEFHLFKAARHSGNESAARALGRRLTRLWPWIPSDEPEVTEFRTLWSTYRSPHRQPVARGQLAGASRRNSGGT